MTAPTNTTFSAGTKITSQWLNGVNDHVNNLEADPHPSYLSKTEAATTYTTQADLASSDAGKGAGLVGALDGASGTLWTTVAGFIAKIISSAGASVIGYARAGASAVTRTIYAKFFEIATVTDYGAIGDDSTDNNAAFLAAIASGAKKIIVPEGVYYFAAAPVWDSLVGVTFIGDGSKVSLLRWDDGRFAIKSPQNVEFLHIGFSPNPSDTSYPVIYVSNYSDIKFDFCRFEGFGAASGVNKAGSTCLYLYAGDTASASIAAGDSSGGVVTNSEFYGNGRKTNFGVRVYTEFDGSTVVNVNNRILNNTFSGFNWNAVEIAGPKTGFNIVSDCTALLCGLIPFDIDKGSHSNIITNITIRRLLGNIDTDVNSNTAIAVCGVAGRYPTSEYSYNNTVSNVVAYLLKSDLTAYARRAAAVALYYAHGNTVENVRVYIDEVPDKPATDGFGFACVMYDTVADNAVKGVSVVNASAGIMQTGAFNAAMTYSGPNRFTDIKNTGTMNAEIISQNVGEGNGGRSQCIYDDISMTTDLSQPYVSGLTYSYAVLAKGDFSSLNYCIIKNSSLTINHATAYFACDRIAQFAVDNVQLLGNFPATSRFIHSEGSTIPQNLGLRRVTANFGQDPIDLSTSLQYLDQSCSICSGITEAGGRVRDTALLYASAAPTYPPIASALWNSNLKIERITKVAGSYEGWVAVGTAWKTYGAISA